MKSCRLFDEPRGDNSDRGLFRGFIQQPEGLITINQVQMVKKR